VDRIPHVCTTRGEAIEAGGGKTLLGKTEVPGVSWYALFADPTGNRMALYIVQQKN